MSNNQTNRDNFNKLSGELNFEDLELLADQQAETLVGGAPKGFGEGNDNPGAIKKKGGRGREISQIARSGGGRDAILDAIFNEVATNGNI